MRVTGRHRRDMLATSGIEGDMQRSSTARAAFAAAVLIYTLPSAAGADETCAPEAGSSHGVLKVIDGETLRLEDGRDVRLVGSLAPKADPFVGDDALGWPPARDAARALDALAAGRRVTLRYDSRRRDRYGRGLAQVYVGTPDGEVWVQEHLIREGHGRAYALPGHTRCLHALVAAEKEARDARRGLWRDEAHRIRSAEEVEALSRLVGRFVIVEGRVAGVTRARRLTYLNFDADWRRDFTASLANAAVDRSPGGADNLTGLKGLTIRVRGWIEQRNGPMMVLSSPEEIEALEETGEALQR